MTRRCRWFGHAWDGWILLVRPPDYGDETRFWKRRCRRCGETEESEWLGTDDPGPLNGVVRG